MCWSGYQHKQLIFPNIPDQLETIVLSSIGTLIQFRISEFTANFPAAVPVTVLYAMAGRTQAGHSQGNLHKALEMKLPLRGQQIQLGTKALDSSDLPLACFFYTVFRSG